MFVMRVCMCVYVVWVCVIIECVCMCCVCDACGTCLSGEKKEGVCCNCGRVGCVHVISFRVVHQPRSAGRWAMGSGCVHVDSECGSCVVCVCVFVLRVSEEMSVYVCCESLFQAGMDDTILRDAQYDKYDVKYKILV